MPDDGKLTVGYGLTNERTFLLGNHWFSSACPLSL